MRYFQGADASIPHSPRRTTNRGRMKKALALSLIFVLLTAGLVQATQVKLINDPSVPGATGTVNVNKDRNGNYRVRVDVRHLAKPTELTPPRQVYLVWVQSGDNAPEVLGQLRVNENLQGSLE